MSKRLKKALNYQRNIPRCGTCKHKTFKGKVWCELMRDGVANNSVCDAWEPKNDK